MPDPETKLCFVIAPLGDPETEVRKRSDQVMKHVIQPASKSCGYEAMRADQISEPGMITTQIIQHIIDDPMLVADLTGRNPNVFYELAIRHALRKPYVQIIQRGERIPFDVAAIRTVEVDHHDLDSVEGARRKSSVKSKRCREEARISKVRSRLPSISKHCAKAATRKRGNWLMSWRRCLNFDRLCRWWKRGLVTSFAHSSFLFERDLNTRSPTSD